MGKNNRPSTQLENAHTTNKKKIIIKHTTDL